MSDDLLPAAFSVSPSKISDYHKPRRTKQPVDVNDLLLIRVLSQLLLVKGAQHHTLVVKPAEIVLCEYWGSLGGHTHQSVNATLLEVRHGSDVDLVRGDRRRGYPSLPRNVLAKAGNFGGTRRRAYKKIA